MRLIKKGNLNFDQSGRAYPDEPQIQENWNCIWECEGKYYELVGDNEHKEWSEVTMGDTYIDYNGRRYYYEYGPAKHRESICLATKDPKKYCNGFYLYSTKDPGNGYAFVVTAHDNPDENPFEN